MTIGHGEPASASSCCPHFVFLVAQRSFCWCCGGRRCGRSALSSETENPKGVPKVHYGNDYGTLRMIFTFLRTFPMPPHFKKERARRKTKREEGGFAQETRPDPRSFPKRRYYAVLHIPPVDSPEKAVRASIVSEAKK